MIFKSSHFQMHLLHMGQKFKFKKFKKPEIQNPDIPKARNCKIQKFQKSEIQNQEKTNFFVQDVLS